MAGKFGRAMGKITTLVGIAGTVATLMKDNPEIMQAGSKAVQSGKNWVAKHPVSEKAKSAGRTIRRVTSGGASDVVAQMDAIEDVLENESDMLPADKIEDWTKRLKQIRVNCAMTAKTKGKDHRTKLKALRQRSQTLYDEVFQAVSVGESTPQETKAIES